MATPTPDFYSGRSGELLVAGLQPVNHALGGAAAGVASAFGGLSKHIRLSGAGTGVAGASGDLIGVGGFSSDITTVSLSMTGVQPFTFGQAFKKGDIPSGEDITSSDVMIFQADVRNRWPDGSVRYAVLSGVSSAGAKTICVGGTPYSGSNVAEPAIDAVVSFVGVTDYASVAVGGGSFSASVATARANGSMAWTRTTAHKVREILGPVMSEFHYFVPTADPHTHVWFYVRAYSTGDVEVETVVENGWLQVAGPGRRDYHVSVSVGGTQRYNSGGVTKLKHYHHTRWGRVDWVGDDPGVGFTHDTTYLQSTKMVPAFDMLRLPASTYSNFPEYGQYRYTTYTREAAHNAPPFFLHSQDPAMGSGGDNSEYGVVPRWMAIYLVEGHAGARLAVEGNGRSAMRWCLHYRDEATGRPAAYSLDESIGLSPVSSNMSTNGNWTAQTPDPTGGAPSIDAVGGVPVNNWAASHAPASAYSAYLVSGRWSMMEELQFQVSSQYLGYRAIYRRPDGVYRRGLGWWVQPRFKGAEYRDRTQQALISPEYLAGVAVTGADATRTADSMECLKLCIDEYYDQNISGWSTGPETQARNNAFGVQWHEQDSTFDGSAVDGEWAHSGLMLGLVGFPVFYSFDSEPNLGANYTTRLGELCVFMARLPVGLMGAAVGGENWNWRVCTFVNLSLGQPGYPPSGGLTDVPQTYFPNWNACWNNLVTSNAWHWQDGTDFNPSDNRLRKFEVGSSDPRMRFRVLSDYTGDTDARSLFQLLAYAHTISDRLTIPGIDIAMRRLVESDTYINVLTTGATFRPDGVYKSRIYAPPPAWVPATVGQAALVPMTNTAEDALDPSFVGLPYGTGTSALLAFSGGVFNKWIGQYGAHVIHGGGHAATDDNSVILADMNTLTFRRVGGPDSLGANEVLYTVPPYAAGSDSYGNAYSYYIMRGTSSTGRLDPTNAALWATPDTEFENPREIKPGIPGSAHTYDMLVCLPPSVCGDAQGALLRVGGFAVGAIASRSTAWAHAFKFSSATWHRSVNSFGTASVSSSIGQASSYDTRRGKIWSFAIGNTMHLGSFEPSSMTWTPYLWTSRPNLGGYGDNIHAAYYEAADANVWCSCDVGEATQRFAWFPGDSANGSQRNLITWTNGSAPAAGATPGGGSLIYIPPLRRLIWYGLTDRDHYYEIEAPTNRDNPWTWYRRPLSGVLPSSFSPSVNNSVYKRMDYAPALKSLIWVAGKSGNFGIGDRVLCIRIVP